MSRTSKACVVAAAFPLVVASCGEHSDDSGRYEWNGREFYLEEAVGYTPMEDVLLSIDFARYSRLVHYRAGCNHFYSEYRIKDNRLILLNVGHTLMHSEQICDNCTPDALMVQESWYNDFLTEGPSIRIDGNWLTISAKTTLLTYLDRVVTDPNRPLTDRKWRIEEIYKWGGIEEIPWTYPSSWVTFFTDGSVSVIAGCSTGEGTYVASDAKLAFGEFAFTARSCNFGDGTDNNDIDHAIQSIFTGTANYSIYISRLLIEHANGRGLLAFTE